MSDFIETVVEDNIATITIDHAERHNSLVPELLEELLGAISTVDGDDMVHAVVLQTSGPSFSTGGDVAGFYENRDNIIPYAERTVGGLNEVMLAMMDCEAPVIAAVDGIVNGGSLGLLLAADIVLIGTDTTITPYYAVVGFSPDGGWTAILPDIIGRQRTARILMANDTIQPDKAVEWGIASEVVTKGSVKSEAQALAADIVQNRQGTIRRSKSLVTADRSTIAAGLRAETESFIEQIQTTEARKGMEAFLDID